MGRCFYLQDRLHVLGKFKQAFAIQGTVDILGDDSNFGSVGGSFLGERFFVLGIVRSQQQDIHTAEQFRSFREGTGFYSNWQLAFFGSFSGAGGLVITRKRYQVTFTTLY